VHQDYVPSEYGGVLESAPPQPPDQIVYISEGLLPSLMKIETRPPALIERRGDEAGHTTQLSMIATVTLAQVGWGRLARHMGSAVAG